MEMTKIRKRYGIGRILDKNYILFYYRNNIYS